MAAEQTGQGRAEKVEGRTAQLVTVDFHIRKHASINKSIEQPLRRLANAWSFFFIEGAQ
jgi:hypothetical protein